MLLSSPKTSSAPSPSYTKLPEDSVTVLCSFTVIELTRARAGAESQPCKTNQPSQDPASVADTCDPSTWEAKPEGMQLWANLGYKIQSKSKQINKNHYGLHGP